MGERHGGRLVYLTQDELGPIEVVEQGPERRLHFGTGACQSAMLLAHPQTLVLRYTRAMLAALLLNPEPRRVLLMGLGGGSLVRFLLAHYPQLSLHALELRPAVAEVARDWFGLPEGERLRITLGDGADYILSAPLDEGHRYDLILLDGFDAAGIAPSVGGEVFFSMCHERLLPGGALAINLWCEDTLGVDDYLEPLGLAFGDRPLRLPLAGRDNLIGLVGREPVGRRRFEQLAQQAARLDARLDLGMSAFARQLRREAGGRRRGD